MTRMPIWGKARSADPIRVHWLTWLLICNAIWCAVNLLGLTGFTPPILPIGGTCLLLISSVLLGLGFSVAGGGVGVFAWTVFGLAALTPVDIGSLCYSIGMGGWNVLVFFDVGSGLDDEREAKQLRP